MFYKVASLYCAINTRSPSLPMYLTSIVAFLHSLIFRRFFICAFLKLCQLKQHFFELNSRFRLGSPAAFTRIYFLWFAVFNAVGNFLLVVVSSAFTFYTSTTSDAWGF